MWKTMFSGIFLSIFFIYSFPGTPRTSKWRCWTRQTSGEWSSITWGTGCTLRSANEMPLPGRYLKKSWILGFLFLLDFTEKEKWKSLICLLSPPATWLPHNGPHGAHLLGYNAGRATLIFHKIGKMGQARVGSAWVMIRHVGPTKLRKSHWPLRQAKWLQRARGGSLISVWGCHNSDYK